MTTGNRWATSLTIALGMLLHQYGRFSHYFDTFEFMKLKSELCLELGFVRCHFSYYSVMFHINGIDILIKSTIIYLPTKENKCCSFTHFFLRGKGLDLVSLVR